MAEVRWTENSLNDIREIAGYISKSSEKYAQIQVQRFFDKVSLVEEMDFKGRMVPELQRKEIRELLCGNYRIVFKIITRKKVDIISVHHGARLLENAMKGRIRLKRK